MRAGCNESVGGGCSERVGDRLGADLLKGVGGRLDLAKELGAGGLVSNKNVAGVGRDGLGDGGDAKERGQCDEQLHGGVHFSDCGSTVFGSTLQCTETDSV